MLGTNFLWRPAILLAAWLGAISPVCAQSRPAARPVRMQVLEQREAPATQHAYAILGGTSRAGVYVSERPRIEQRELLNAAGAGENAGAVKIVRSQRSASVHLPGATLGPERVDLLEPGDVVILPGATANGDRLISIACIGLTAQPIVLSLDDQIPNIDVLVQRLLQPASLAKSARVVSPQGQLNNGRFMNGTVVFFNPREVDKIALASAPPFPSVIDLDTPQVAAAVAPVHLPQQDPVDVQSLLPEPAPAPVLPIPPVVEVAELPQPAMVAPLLRSPTEFALPPRSPLADAPLVASAPLGQVVAAVELQPVALPPRLTQSIPLQPQPTIQLPGELEREPRAAAAPRADAPWWPLTLGVTVLAAICMLLSLLWARWDAQQLAAAIQRRAIVQQVTTPAAEPMQAPVTAAAAAPALSSLEQLLQGAVPMVEEPVTIAGERPLHGVVVGHRRLRIDAAHTEIAAPHFAREVRTSRRKVAAGSTSAAERALRESLRADLRRSESMAEEAPWLTAGSEWELRPDGDFTVPPAAPAIEREVPERLEAALLMDAATDDGSDFDIVQPSDSPLHRKAKSALDRALRTLNQEKRT